MPFSTPQDSRCCGGCSREAGRPARGGARSSASLAAIDLGFWFFEPQLQWYVGASGLLHGVFAFGCLALVRQRDPVGIIAAVIFVAKLSWEHWQGPLPFERNAPVVTVAHLYGAWVEPLRLWL